MSDGINKYDSKDSDNSFWDGIQKNVRNEKKFFPKKKI